MMRRSLLAALVVLAALNLVLAGPAQAGPRRTRVARAAAMALNKNVTLDRRVVRQRGVTRQGSRLLLDGKPFVFTGVNAPQAATHYDVNGGCGAAIDLDRLFAGLAPNSVVRVGFGQDTAINGVTGQRDWRALDRVMAAAERSTNQVRLIIGITNQAGICDGGHWRGHDWYAGGFRDVPPPSPPGYEAVPRVSYWDWIHELVPRYAGSRSIAMWEPVGEPEAAVCAAGYIGSDCYGHKTCPADATAVLRAFFDEVGGEFHRMDPGRLVASGSLGGDQCGWAGDGSLQIQASPGIDVATFHDYGSDTIPISPWLDRRINEAAALGKPLISEETGINAGYACTSVARRAELLEAKRRAGEARGVDGFLPWVYSQSTEAVACDHQIRPDDPFMAILAGIPSI